MASAEDIKNQQDLLEIYRRNLALYAKQRAMAGAAYVQAGIENNIREAQQEIARVKRILRDWHVPVEDQPDDSVMVADPPIDAPNKSTAATIERQIEEREPQRESRSAHTEHKSGNRAATSRKWNVLDSNKRITRDRSTYDVFISYALEDENWVWNWLVPRLREGGIKLCIDQEFFTIDLSKEVNTERAVRASRHMLLVITPAWLEKSWPYFEAILVADDDSSSLLQRTVALLLTPTELPARIARLQYADFTHTAHAEEEYAELQSILRGGPSEPEPLPKSTTRISEHHLEERFLDAALPKQVLVQWKTELLVMIRLPDSPGLQKILAGEIEFQAQPEDVKSHAFKVEFPNDERGDTLYLDLAIEIETDDFQVTKSHESVRIWPSEDTSPLIFSIIPLHTGELSLIIRVYVMEGALIGSGMIRANGTTKFREDVRSIRTLISVALGSFGIAGIPRNKTMQQDLLRMEAELEQFKQRMERGLLLLGLGEQDVVRAQAQLEQLKQWMEQRQQALGSLDQQDLLRVKAELEQFKLLRGQQHRLLEAKSEHDTEHEQAKAERMKLKTESEQTQMKMRRYAGYLRQGRFEQLALLLVDKADEVKQVVEFFENERGRVNQERWELFKKWLLSDTASVVAIRLREIVEGLNLFAPQGIMDKRGPARLPNTRAEALPLPQEDEELDRLIERWSEEGEDGDKTNQ